MAPSKTAWINTCVMTLLTLSCKLPVAASVNVDFEILSPELHASTCSQYAKRCSFPPLIQMLPQSLERENSLAPFWLSRLSECPSLQTILATLPHGDLEQSTR